MIKSVFDLSFDKFITLKLIGIVYALVLVLIGLSALIGLIGVFTAETGGGAVLMLLMVAIGTVLGVLLARVGAEGIAVIFRINENLKAIRNHAPYLPPKEMP